MVYLRDNETFESLIRRFNRQVNDSNLVGEMQKRRYAMSPSAKRKFKRQEACRIRRREEGKRRRNRERLERLGLIQRRDTEGDD